MTVEQKPGLGYCMVHPVETIKAIRIKAKSIACMGPGTITSPLEESILEARGLSIPEITKRFVTKNPT